MLCDATRQYRFRQQDSILVISIVAVKPGVTFYIPNEHHFNNK